MEMIGEKIEMSHEIGARESVAGQSDLPGAELIDRRLRPAREARPRQFPVGPGQLFVYTNISCLSTMSLSTGDRVK